LKWLLSIKRVNNLLKAAAGRREHSRRRPHCDGIIHLAQSCYWSQLLRLFSQPYECFCGNP